jgi:hypothetical protein
MIARGRRRTRATSSPSRNSVRIDRIPRGPMIRNFVGSKVMAPSPAQTAASAVQSSQNSPQRPAQRPPSQHTAASTPSAAPQPPPYAPPSRPRPCTTAISSPSS